MERYMYAHGGPRSGQKGSILFLEIVDFLFFGEQRMGGGAHSAPLGMAICPNKRVRAAHGRARAAKTH